MSHTQGRLKAKDSRIYFAGLAGGFDIRDCPSPEENARRLVACWNACDGMRTESIEELAEMGHGVPRLAVFADAAKKQRDELLEALKECLDCEFAVTDKAAIEKARAAIEKAEEKV